MTSIHYRQQWLNLDVVDYLLGSIKDLTRSFMKQTSITVFEGPQLPMLVPCRHQPSCIGVIWSQNHKAFVDFCDIKMIKGHEMVMQAGEGEFVVYSPETFTAQGSCVSQIVIQHYIICCSIDSGKAIDQQGPLKHFTFYFIPNTKTTLHLLGKKWFKLSSSIGYNIQIKSLNQNIKCQCKGNKKSNKWFSEL